MDRKLLQYFISSGPSKKLDVIGLARGEDGIDRSLFKTKVMNHTIIFKYLNTHDSDLDMRASPLRTLVFFPYDTESPSEGGESVIFSRAALQDYLTGTKGCRHLNLDHFYHDVSVLEVMDSIPSLSPFLLEEAFKRRGIVLNSNLQILEKSEGAVLRERIRARLRPLVHAAMAGMPSRAETTLDKIVDVVSRGAKLDPIWPMIDALRIPRKDAMDILSSWVGICFFEYEYNQLQDGFRDFAHWFSEHDMPSEPLPRDETETLRASADCIRKKLRLTVGQGYQIIFEYQSTYNDFIQPQGSVEPFLKFLRNAKPKFWRLGEMVGKIEQTVYAWRTYTRHYEDRPLPYNRLLDFYQILNASN